MGYAKIRIFQGNKKEQVLDNLVEKNGQVSDSRIRGTSVSTWKKEEKREKKENDSPWSL